MALLQLFFELKLLLYVHFNINPSQQKVEQSTALLTSNMDYDLCLTHEQREAKLRRVERIRERVIRRCGGGGLFSFLHSVNVLYIDESLSKLAVVCLSAQSERVPLHTVSSRLWERRRKFTMFPLMQRENKD